MRLINSTVKKILQELHSHYVGSVFFLVCLLCSLPLPDASYATVCVRVCVCGGGFLAFETTHSHLSIYFADSMLDHKKS